MLNIIKIDYMESRKVCDDMGGRGIFASGNSVAYTYETVGVIEGDKVLYGLNSKHNLPEEAHSSSAYILTDANRKFIRYLEFNLDHTSKFDIDFHSEKKIFGNYNPVLHIHEYKNGIHFPLGRILTENEHRKL